MFSEISSLTGIPESEIRLMSGLKQLQRDQTLADAGLIEDATVSMTMRLAGGKKKKKKKNYTTPKRIPHKHESKKMRVLEYFKVSDDGKITKLKQESTEHAGCYLADHKDRMHCGRTGAFMFYKLTKDGQRIAPVQNKPKKAKAAEEPKKAGKKKKK